MSAGRAPRASGPRATRALAAAVRTMPYLSLRRSDSKGAASFAFGPRWATASVACSEAFGAEAPLPFEWPFPLACPLPLPLAGAMPMGWLALVKLAGTALAMSESVPICTVFGWGFFLLGWGPWTDSRFEEGEVVYNAHLLTTKLVLYLVPRMRKATDDPEAINLARPTHRRWCSA